MKKKNIFYTIDDKIFAKVNLFKSSRFYEYYREFVEKLPDIQQKYVHMIVAYIVIATPLFMAFLLFLGNLNKTSELDQKIKILEEIHSFNQKKNTITSLGTTLVTNPPVHNQSAFQNRLSNIAGQIPISIGNISILSFNTINTGHDLTELKGQVKFEKLSTKQFSSFLSLLTQNKFNIEVVDVKKNQDDNSLQGTLDLIFFRKK